MAAVEAVVAAIDRLRSRLALAGLSLAVMARMSLSLAAVLPEDRADALYHAYSGGGVEVTGPSILVRKKLADELSVVANYYVDMVSSASIDVVTTASPYSEERTQYSVGVDYLHDRTSLSMNYINSSENDYEANTASFSISQDFFGDLTTLTLGYARGDDTVRRNGQADFQETVSRQNYQVSVTQIVTRNMLISLVGELVTDEGFLNNPYRSVRYLDPTTPLGYGFQSEIYPRTRTSNTGAVTVKYFLPYRAALMGKAKYFADTWGISAQAYELEYTHPVDEHLIIDAGLRFYSQSRADFYADLFPFQNAQNFLARDKELSTFSSIGLEAGASYEWSLQWGPFKKGSVNLKYNRIRFTYDDFRNITVAATPGTEPLYEFDADVIRAFFSVWY